MVFEWIALAVAFGIFFAVIIDKYVDNCECDCCPSEIQYEHLKTD